MRLPLLSVFVPLLVAISACAPAVPARPAYLVPDLSIERVAVAPIFFADEPIDWYYGERIAGQLRRETQEQLEKKGYETILSGDTLVRFPPPERDLSRLVPPVPPPAEGVMVIRIDLFLDASLYGNDGGGTNTAYFEIYATAALVDANGRVLWQDEGVGRGSRSGSTLTRLEEFTVPAELADSLFDTLPAVRPR